ncbi:MAG: DUF3194 domain-containing protein [Candidatus Bathyarchaeota archaeon]
MVENGITELTIEQLEILCESAEKVTRDYILSQVPVSKISDFDIAIEAEGTKPVDVKVEVSIVLSPIMKDCNVEELTKEATKRAFTYIEEYFRELKCTSKK